MYRFIFFTIFVDILKFPLNLNTSKGLQDMTLKLYKDMRLMNRDELAFHFAARGSKRIKLQPLMRAAILQVHARIQAGDEDPIWGNIRTVWYRYIKPILSHA